MAFPRFCWRLIILNRFVLAMISMVLIVTFSPLLFLFLTREVNPGDFHKATIQEGQYLPDSAGLTFNESSDYFRVVKVIDPKHYIIKDPEGNLYYCSQCTDGHIIIGGLIPKCDK